MTERKSSTPMFDAAKRGDWEECKRLLSTHDANMAIMGACEGAEELKEVEQTPEVVAQKKLLKKIWNWSLENGACILFGFQHEGPQVEYVKSGFNAKKYRMLSGPGEVSRGTFKKNKD